MLYYVLDRCHGDFYVSTVSGMAMYWERVLCPEHREVEVAACEDGSVRIANTGQAALDRLPVEIEFASGKKMMILADLAPNQQKTFKPGRPGE